MPEIKINDTVKIHYTGKFEDGQVFDSSKEREPLEFQVGAGKMIPGFEEAVLGMDVNDSKTVSLTPDKAYGPKRDELVQDVGKDKLPEGMEPQVGQQLMSVNPETKQEIVVTVTDVADEKITVDANHPLAGKNLVFDIEVVDVK